jgi:hypothetical protein
LDVLYGGIGISKLHFLIKKKEKTNFQLYFFLQFFVIKTLDLDPDPDSAFQVNPDQVIYNSAFYFFLLIYSHDSLHRYRTKYLMIIFSHFTSIEISRKFPFYISVCLSLTLSLAAWAGKKLPIT